MKILILSRWLPYPADNGSKIRIRNVISELSRANDVSLLSFCEYDQREQRQHAMAALRSCCASVQTVVYQPGRSSVRALFNPQPRAMAAEYSPSMSAAVALQVAREKPDIVVATELAMVPYALEVAGVPRVLEDLELSVFTDALRQGPARARMRAAVTWLKLARYIRRVLPRFDVCTVVSEVEQARVLRVVPGFEAVEIVPNGVDLPSYDQYFGSTPRPNTLIFSGALSYHANYDAVNYFLDAIYPSVIRGLPDTILRVTGRTTGSDVGRLPNGPGVHYTGYVEDVRPLIAESWASVVPLRIGGGTRLKILESMALGTPVVATSKGAEGLAVSHGRNILLADGVAPFVAQVQALLRSTHLRTELAANGRWLVESTYNWGSIGNELRRLVQNVVDRSRASPTNAFARA